MKRHFFGYFLGLLIFVIGIPALMWLASGQPWLYTPDSSVQCVVAILFLTCGLALSIYSIVYMRIVGKGNPFDAYGHEVAPRTRHLMTDGPYHLCRNPMLLGIYIYDLGVLVWLWSPLPLIIVLAEVILLTLQVRSEEKRLEKDFGQEYLDYKTCVGRYFPSGSLCCLKKVCDFIARWMGAMVLLVAALALVIPASFASINPWAINPMLGIIMFGMGLTLSPSDLRIVVSRPKDILIGCLAQFTVMPLLAFFLSWVFMLPKELALGVILVGCCPGGTASNVITYLAKGDLALSVGMTATSTLLAPLLTPLLVWLMAGTMVDVDTLSMLLSIVYVVIAPIVCGLLCQRYLRGMTKRIVPYLPAFSSIVIALVVGIVVSHNAERLMVGGLVIVFVVIAHNVLGLSAGFVLSRLIRLPRAKCVAVSIEVGMQNSGLASSLAVLHFAAYPLASIPGAVFSVWHNISGALVAGLARALDRETDDKEVMANT